MEKRHLIDSFFASGTYAIAGVSRNRNKFGTALFRDMKKKGLNTIGINPHMSECEGSPCYSDVQSLPDGIEALVTTVKSDQTLGIVQAAYEKGINRIWMQQGTQTDEAIDFCKEKGMIAVNGECIYMYLEPLESIHKFHRGINKLFGKYHKKTG